MDKREWRNEVPLMSKMVRYSATERGLWAIVERLEALVGIMDRLEEVGDLWANSLAFGGQPVGGIDQPVPATRHEWMCDKKECILMKDHGGECVKAPLQLCQCMKPVVDTGGVCSKCGFPQEVKSDATKS